jgi:ABC-type multidrug transport system permease subunit
MTAALLILRKDLVVLRRSPALVAILLAYPILIAVLIGLTATYANAKPRVAFVDEDDLPATVVVAGHRFHIARTIDEVAKNVTIARMSANEAQRQLRSGRVAAVVTIPDGFLRTLVGLVRSPTLTLELGQGGITPRVRQQMQALVYNLNRSLQSAFIEADLEYVKLLLKGGQGEVLGRRFHVLGLEGTRRLLEELPRGERLDRIRDFVHDATAALSLTGDAIRATANPIELVEETDRGRTWTLSAQVQSYALALTISFLALVLSASALAAERDENTIGRLSRGLVRLGELVSAKVALAAAVALGLGTALAVLFGVAIEIGNVTGGEPWERLPLLVVGLLLAGAALGALGATVGGLAREARTASLVAILIVLPIVFLGLVPREIVPVAGWISDAFPFVHAVRFFASSLFDTDPWATLGREAAWLAGLAAVYGAVARLAARRLVA